MGVEVRIDDDARPTFGTDHQLHTFAGDEIERFIYIGYLVKSRHRTRRLPDRSVHDEPHAASIGLHKLLVRDHFEEQHQFESILKVFVDVLNRRADLAQMRIAPGRECLRNDRAVQRVGRRASTLDYFLLLPFPGWIEHRLAFPLFFGHHVIIDGILLRISAAAILLLLLLLLFLRHTIVSVHVLIVVSTHD